MAPYRQIESLSEDALLKLETQLHADIHDETDYSRLLRWRLLPPRQRPVDPYGTTTQEQAADLIIRSEMNSAEARRVNVRPKHFGQLPLSRCAKSSC
jgi:hypothetical protein